MPQYPPLYAFLVASSLSAVEPLIQYFFAILKRGMGLQFLAMCWSSPCVLSKCTQECPNHWGFITATGLLVTRQYSILDNTKHVSLAIVTDSSHSFLHSLACQSWFRGCERFWCLWFQNRLRLVAVSCGCVLWLCLGVSTTFCDASWQSELGQVSLPPVIDSASLSQIMQCTVPSWWRLWLRSGLKFTFWSWQFEEQFV